MFPGFSLFFFMLIILSKAIYYYILPLIQEKLINLLVVKIVKRNYPGFCISYHLVPTFLVVGFFKCGLSSVFFCNITFCSFIWNYKTTSITAIISLYLIRPISLLSRDISRLSPKTKKVSLPTINSTSPSVCVFTGK